MIFKQKSPWTKGWEKFEGSRGLINMSLRQLLHYQEIGSSNKPEELSRDIKIMQWLLSQEDSEEKCSQFLDCRYQERHNPLDRHKVMELCGFNYET